MLHRVVFGILAATPGVVLAATEPATPLGGGMPQLRFGDPWVIGQVVWMLVLFGLLYYVMSTYALPRVASVLEDRRRRIEGDLETARLAKAEADAAIAAQRAGTDKARAEAQTAIAGAVKAAQADAQARSDVLAARLAEQIAAADQRIGASRDAAMGALREVATDTTEALLTRLTGRADTVAVADAVDRALAARAPG